MTSGAGPLVAKNLGIRSRARARATGLSTGTIPFSPYNVIHNCSALIPAKLAHFIARTKLGLRFPSSTIESMLTLQPTARAMMPRLLMVRPSPVTKTLGALGSAFFRALFFFTTAPDGTR